MLLKESVNRKINTSIWFHCTKKKTVSLIEDKKKGKVQMGLEGPTFVRTPKRHIPLVSLLL